MGAGTKDSHDVLGALGDALDDRGDWQPLPDHLWAVSQLAGEVGLSRSAILDEVSALVRQERAGFDLPMVARMLFPCRTDADFKGTEAHCF